MIKRMTKNLMMVGMVVTVIGFSGIATAALLTEDWESGSIDASKWDTMTGGSASTIQEVRNISHGTGQYVLVQAVGTGSYGYAYIQSKSTFDTDGGLVIKYSEYRRTDSGYTSSKDAIFRILDGSDIMVSLNWVGKTGYLYGYRITGGANTSMGGEDLSSSLNKWTDWTITYTPGIQPMLSVVAYEGTTEIYNKNVTIDAMDNVKIQFKTWNDDSKWNWVRWDDISVDVPEPATIGLLASGVLGFIRRR